MKPADADTQSKPGSPLANRVFIAVMLYLAFAWTGSIPPLTFIIIFLLAGYAYLHRREIGWEWVALPLALAGFWVLASGFSLIIR